jgi:MaoC like domain/short chain dehydrogenase
MLAERTFTASDQAEFAAVSGDRNPMHLDAVLARRTQAGAPVVHGVHLLLWGLDALARAEPALPPARRLRAQFKHFAAVDERVAATAARSEASVRLDFVSAGMTVAQLVVDFGAAGQAGKPLSGEALPVPAEARDLSFDAMAGLSGRLAFATPPDVIAAMFPAASGWLGQRRVAALGATTLLVGMVCPGLHSIYAGLTAETCDEPVREDRLGFRVMATEPRFRSARMAVAGGGLAGEVQGYLRTAPTPQASVRDLEQVVEPGEFSGATALIIGGSRGLGEVAAKLLAAGGAKVAISYRVGAAEAEAVAREIRSIGVCETLAYDVSLPAEAQLAGLGAAPTHAYYFATPTIYRAQAALFARTRLDAFLNVYVEGFLNLAEALRARRKDVSLFYPSSVFVAERPRGMLEYSMAKAAGETLCAEMNQAWPPLHVTVDRLPRLRTDQTASVIGASLPSPAERLLTVVRETQSWPRGAAQGGPLQTASAG